MKRYTIDKNIFEQVIKATPSSSPFGIENLPTKIDYIQLYIMDMNDNLLLKDYLSQDEINQIDGKVVDIDVGQHLRNAGYTEGDYKVKYYFMSSIAGLPENADKYGEPAYYYVDFDNNPYYGEIKKRIVGGIEKCYYLNTEGTEEIPLKKLENKYLITDINSDRTEVKIDVQNIKSSTYIDKIRSILRQKPIPRTNFAYSRSGNYSLEYPPAHLKFDSSDPYILELIPQFDGDPGFDVTVINKPIVIRDVYEFQGPQVSITGTERIQTTPSPQEIQQFLMDNPGANAENLSSLVEQEVERLVRDTVKIRFKSKIIEVLDYNRVRLEKSFDDYESDARALLQKKLDMWNGVSEQVRYFDTKYDEGQRIRFGDGNFAPQKNLNQSMFQQVSDKNRIFVPGREIGMPKGNSWVIWTPQTNFARLDTYLVINDQYYLIAQGSEGYGKDGTIWGGSKDGTFAPNPGRPGYYGTEDVLGRYFKLYKPLETDIKLYDKAYIVQEKLVPYEDKVKLIPFIDDFDENLQFLRIPNINAKDNPVRPRKTNFKSFTELNGNNELVKDRLTERIFSGSLLDTRLNVDYGRRDASIPDKNDYGFGKFVNYGSAQKRIENFRKKLVLVETYTSQSGVYSNISSSLETKTKFRKLKNNVISSFDHFEHFMYYESSSYTTSSLGERFDVTWPKTSYSNNLYTLAPTTSSLGNTFYNKWITYSKEFDSFNKERFVSNLPVHVSMDPANKTFLDFFDMIGQQFDEYWLYTRHFTDLNERSSRLGEGISKDLVEQVAKSIGLELVNGNDLLELPQYLFGTDATGSAAYSISQEDVTKEIYKRILSNMPFFSKSKGSIRAMKGLLNCYGIPSSILRVREYGGPDVGQRVSFEVKRKFNYALDFKGSQYVQHTWRPDSISNTYPDTVEFRFRTPHSIGSSGSMAIVQTNDRWAIGLKDNGTNDAYGHLFFGISGSDGSSSRISLGEQPFYNDDMWSVMLSRVSSSGAPLTTNGIDSKVKYELIAKQYDSTREVILYQTSGSVIVDGSGGSGTSGYKQNQYWVTSTNTRLGGNSNGNFGSLFSGSLMEYRLWTEPLLQTKFDDHVRAPKAYNGNSPSSSYENLVFKLPLNDNISMTNASTLDDKSGRTSYEAEATTNGFGGNNNFRSIVDKEQVKIPNIGPNRRNATKIRVEEQQLGDRLLSPETRAAASAYDTAPLDSNKVGIYFSPVDVINEDILYSLADFDFDDLVGDPRDEFELNFRGLAKAQRDYWRKYSSPNNFFDYLRILQYYDSGLFDQIRSFIPARANATLGVLIEPNMLERDKEVIGKLPEIDNLYFENANQFQAGLQISNNKSGSDAAVLRLGGEFYQNEGNLNLTGYSDKAGEPGGSPNGSLNLNTLNSLDKIDGKSPFGSTYVSASITFGGTIAEYTETLQPNISSSRLSEHNQIKRLFFDTPENARTNTPSSSSFHPAEFESMAKDSNLFRVYFKPITLTKENTIDGKDPVEITITSPTTLVSQEPGESPLIVE